VTLRQFAEFAVIDWSGAKSHWHKGIAVAVCKLGEEAPTLMSPPGVHWTRQAVLDWMLQAAKAERNILISLDLSPSLPFVDREAYFPTWAESPADAKALWAMVDHHSHADDHLSVTSFVEHPEVSRHFRKQGACGDLFQPGAGRMRECEAKGQAAIPGINPYSCFNLVGAAQVGKSSLTGMRVLNRIDGAIPFWPFDPLPKRGPALVEIYTSIAARASGVLPKGKSKILDGKMLDQALAAFQSRPHAPLQRYTDHATDAILTAAWLRQAAHQVDLWSPARLTPKIATTEGWTFGVN
jgi:hypothetical protein